MSHHSQSLDTHSGTQQQELFTSSTTPKAAPEPRPARIGYRTLPDLGLSKNLSKDHLGRKEERPKGRPQEALASGMSEADTSACVSGTTSRLSGVNYQPHVRATGPPPFDGNRSFRGHPDTSREELFAMSREELLVSLPPPSTYWTQALGRPTILETIPGSPVSNISLHTVDNPHPPSMRDPFVTDPVSYQPVVRPRKDSPAEPSAETTRAVHSSLAPGYIDHVELRHLCHEILDDFLDKGTQSSVIAESASRRNVASIFNILSCALHEATKERGLVGSRAQANLPNGLLELAGMQMQEQEKEQERHRPPRKDSIEDV